jgi:hypothetical protein
MEEEGVRRRVVKGRRGGERRWEGDIVSLEEF